MSVWWRVIASPQTFHMHEVFVVARYFVLLGESDGFSANDGGTGRGTWTRDNPPDH